MSCRVWYRGCRWCKTGLARGKDVADAFATALILRVTPFTWRVPTLAFVALDLDILQSLVRTCLQTVVASITRAFAQIDWARILCVIRGSAEAENPCLWALHISKFGILSNLTLMWFNKLVLWGVLVYSCTGLSFHLVDEALIVNFDWQNFWVTLCIEGVLICELLLWRSWAMTIIVVGNVQLLALA